jgi:hypothetical protein
MAGDQGERDEKGKKGGPERGSTHALNVK